MRDEKEKPDANSAKNPTSGQTNNQDYPNLDSTRSQDLESKCHPNTLIPQKLKRRDFRFVLLKPKDKIPIEKEWQKKDIEYDDSKLIQHIHLGSNYGIIGGGENNLIILDFDNQKVQDEICCTLPETFTVKTGTGKLHKYFLSDKSQSFKIFDEQMNTLVDVQGEGKQVVCPGSIHPNGNKYIVVEDKEISFLSYPEIQALLMPYDKNPKRLAEQKAILNKAEFSNKFIDQLKSSVPMPKVLESLGIDISKNPTTCLFHESKGGKCFSFTDEVGFCFHCNSGFNIFSLVKEVKKCDFKEALGYLADLVGLTEELEQSQLKWKEKQTECTNKEENKNKPKYTAHFDGLIEIVIDNNENLFFLTKENDDLIVNNFVVIDGITYYPPPKEQLPWKIPRMEKVLEYYKQYKQCPALMVDNKLYKDLVLHHASQSELSDPCYYELFALFDFHSYRLDKFEYSPMILLFADGEHGKTRTAKAIVFCCRRGLLLASFNEPQLLRLATDCRSSLVFDIMDIWKKAEQKGCEDILLNRFEKGAKVSRINHPDRDKFEDTDWYDVYGVTVIATNVRAERILDTRALPITMPVSDQTFNGEVTPELCLPFRERLTAHYAYHIDKELPEINKICSGRLGDLLRPLHQMSKLVNPDGEQDFMKMAQVIKSDRMVEKSQTYHGQVLRAIYEIRDKKRNGILLNRDITDKVNEGVSIDKYKLSPKTVSHTVNSLGFKKHTVHGGGVGFEIDEKILTTSLKAYGVLDNVTNPTILTNDSNKETKTGEDGDNGDGENRDTRSVVEIDVKMDSSENDKNTDKVTGANSQESLYHQFLALYNGTGQEIDHLVGDYNLVTGWIEKNRPDLYLKLGTSFENAYTALEQSKEGKGNIEDFKKLIYQWAEDFKVCNSEYKRNHQDIQEDHSNG